MTGLARLLAAGLTYRQIDVWVHKNWVRPTAKGGTGHPRQWPLREVRIALLMKRLTDAGITPATAATIARRAEHAQDDLGIPELPVTVDLGRGLRLTINPTTQEAAA